MPKSCGAPHCSNAAGQARPPARRLSFYKFPLRDAARLRRWLSQMRRDDWRPGRHHHLCSDHFEPSCFQYRWGVRYLRPDAVPTLFPRGPPKRENGSAPPSGTFPPRRAEPATRPRSPETAAPEVAGAAAPSSHFQPAAPEVASTTALPSSHFQPAAPEVAGTAAAPSHFQPTALEVAGTIVPPSHFQPAAPEVAGAAPPSHFQPAAPEVAGTAAAPSHFQPAAPEVAGTAAAPSHFQPAAPEVAGAAPPSHFQPAAPEVASTTAPPSSHFQPAVPEVASTAAAPSHFQPAAPETLSSSASPPPAASNAAAAARELSTEELAGVALVLQRKVKVLQQRQRRHRARLEAMEELVERLRRESLRCEERLQLACLQPLPPDPALAIVCREEEEEEEELLYAAAPPL